MSVDREQFIEVIAREMADAWEDVPWERLRDERRWFFLSDAASMVDGIARVTEEWLLAAGEVGLARKWRVAMGQREEDGR